MRWLALHLPLLPLEAFCAALPPAQAGRPVALLQQHRVVQVNAAAAERGLRPGLKRATALALAADLLLAERDSGREAAALQAVVHTALAFTPAVTLHDSVHGLHTVLLEVQASLRLFGGLAALHRRLHEALAPLGHQLRTAAAPTARGAALLAQWRPASLPDPVLGVHATELTALRALLAQAPVGLLEAAARHGPALQDMGLHTLADLLAQPRDGLVRRFGQGVLDEIDQAWGRQADPRRWAQLPAVFETRLELFTRADNAEQVGHAAAVVLARLVAWAQARQARVGGFTLRLLHERARQVQAEPTELTLMLAEPALDATHLQALLRERLARLVLAAPTLELQLHCRHLVAAPAPNGELFPSRAAEAQGLTRLLEKLCARLGDEQVLRLVPMADHRPEHATRALPLNHALPTGACRPPPHPPGLALHRPAWLLDEPVPLPQQHGCPTLQGRPLQVLAGPERLAVGWWDGAVTERDYCIASTADGALVWLYRDSEQPPLPGHEVPWMLQGLFG